MLLDSHTTTYHSDVCVLIIVTFNLDTSTIDKISMVIFKTSSLLLGYETHN